MLEHLVFGSGFAFAAAVQPGPLQAFLLAQVVRNGWRRTLPAACAPLISDGPVALLVLLVLRHLPIGMNRMLQAAGGVLLLGFAVAAYRRWRRGPVDLPDGQGAGPRTILQATVVNLLNPGPYVGWSLILGPKVVNAWRQGPANAVGLLVAFYGTMVIMLALTILLFGTTRFLGLRERHRLVLVSALALAALGVYQLGASLRPPGSV
jgi:threonine/homoserine/homoserine lactone efflux protein